MKNNSFLAGFKPMLEALDESFEFLIEDYGFEKTPPEQCSRECVVSYFRPAFVDICIMTEPGGTPFFTLSVKPGALETNPAHTPLRLLAKKRNPHWVEPFIEREGESAPDFRAFFDNYAALLKESFSDVLTVGSTELATDSQPSSSESTVQTSDSHGPNASVAARLWGLLLAVVAFAVIVFEIRYFNTHGTPDATGSVQANWGMLMLIGLPWAVLVTGFLQIISGTSIRHYGVSFSAMALPLRLGIALAAIALSILAAGLAAWIA
ncbi:MAG: hypothetical protein WBN44_04915 [Woeseiaceae bacterium]